MSNAIQNAKQTAKQTSKPVIIRREDGITIGVVLPNGQFHHVAV